MDELCELWTSNMRMQWKQCFNRSNYKFKSSSSPKKILKVLSKFIIKVRKT